MNVLHRQWYLVLLASVGAACGSGAGDAATNPFRELVRIEPDLVVSGNLLPTVVSPENDGFGFALAVDMELVNGRLAVLENRNSRVVFFDDDLRAVRTFGREGAGPGEIRGPMHMAVRGDTIAVGEINNQRVSVFHADGTFERSFGVPTGRAALAIAPSGIIYVVSGATTHYLLAVDDTNASTPFAERPIALYPEDDFVGRYVGIGAELLAVTGDGTVHVGDPHLGAIVSFAPSGERLSMLRLPEDLRRFLRERAAQIAQDFGGSGKGWTSVGRSLTVTDGERLVLTLPERDRVFALLIDPREGTYQAVRGDPALADPLDGGVTIIWGDRVYLKRGDDITVHTIAAAVQD